MSQSLIRAAFEQKLATWAAAQSPAIPVVYQGVKTPIPTGRYAACYLLPLPTASEFLERADRQYSGVFQVNLFISTSTTAAAGMAEGEALAASLDTAFGMRLTNGSLVINLTRPMSIDGPAVPDADRDVLSVSCAYFAATAP